MIYFKKYFFVILLLFILICTICFSTSTYEITQSSIKLWANNVIPSLLPFFICINLLKLTPFIEIISISLAPIVKPLFNLPGSSAFALVLGWISGYPTGAKITSELYLENKLTKSEATRLLAFSNTAGPIFIIGTVRHCYV